MSAKPELLIALALLAPCSWCQEKHDLPMVRIGMVAAAPDAKDPESNNALGPYLASKIPGYSFQVVEFSTSGEIAEAFRKGQLEFATVSPLGFPALEARSNARVIATAKYGYSPDKESALFGSAIVCRKDDQGIRGLSDLRGKRVIVYLENSMGWVAAWREFVDLGIDPRRDFAELRFAGAVPAKATDDAWAAVREGRADAGVITSQGAARLAGRGETWFRFLPPPQQEPDAAGFPFPLSTRLYPAAPFIKAPHVSITLASAVAVALLNIPEGSEAARAPNPPGFTLAMNYAPLHECLRELHLDPYTDYGKVTLSGAIRQHWGAAMLLLSLVALGLAVTTAYVGRLNGRLRKMLEHLDYQGQLLSQTSEAILATAPNGRVTYLNRAAETLFGRGLKEARGMRVEKLLTLSPGDDPALKSGDRLVPQEEGDPRHVELLVSDLLSPSGEASGNVVCVRDVTELRSLEEQYRQAQKLESVGQLAGGVAHDFNNLLTIINGYCRLLISDESAPRQFLPELEAILQAGERAASLTRQLLAFSRKQHLQPTVLNLNRVVANIEPMVTRLIGEQVRVVTALEPALRSVKADSGQLDQVILNLALNARDAMPRGGTLLIETSNLDLNERDARAYFELTPGAWVMLSVSDTGVGMDEQTRGRIFEPFFTTKPPGQGTGLGLSMVYGIVRQSGGHVRVRSERGVGTTFKLLFPAVDAQPVGEPVGAAVSPQGRERILLAEDETGVRGLIARILTENGYQVWPASTGAEARQIAAAREDQIDLLLTDVVMPDTTGPQLATQLLSRHPGLRVLFTSGYTDDVVLNGGVPDRDVAYLQKPFTPAVLLKAIRSVLDAKSGR